jgi:hypothetical protein
MSEFNNKDLALLRAACKESLIYFSLNLNHISLFETMNRILSIAFVVVILVEMSIAAPIFGTTAIANRPTVAIEDYEFDFDAIWKTMKADMYACATADIDRPIASAMKVCGFAFQIKFMVFVLKQTSKYEACVNAKADEIALQTPTVSTETAVRQLIKVCLEV